jgi:hypothetical protein
MPGYLYVGVGKDLSRQVFRSEAKPTEETHGDRYLYTVGPFRTRMGADYMRFFGHNNPHCQTVVEAERLAKRHPDWVHDLRAKTRQCRAGRHNAQI